MRLGIPTDLRPMEARRVDALPHDPGWQFEPKWDGFRCLAFRDDDEVELKSKSGKSLKRYFPEVAKMLGKLRVRKFVLDGELLIAINGRFSFDALQLRLHPAQSRVTRLSREHPATFVVFDCLLSLEGKPILKLPFAERRKELGAFFRSARKHDALQRTPHTLDAELANRWLTDATAQTDGVVAKRLDLPYEPGERAMLKIKRMRTADCVVGGFRYGTGSKLVGSLLLGLYGDDGLLHHVGFTSSIPAADKPELTAKLEKLVAPPGFTGDTPGGPSRWATERSAEWQPLKPKLVAEVRFDHVTDGRFRHATRFIRWRPDKKPRQCTYEQLTAG
jgi:ATP-dependent DNA ligase